MKLKCLLFLTLVVACLQAQTEYEHYFLKNQVRLSYSVYGNSSEATIDSAVFYTEPHWNGSRINLIDTFKYGEFLLNIFHAKTGKLIYSRGYSNLFVEWQLTSYAKDSVKLFRECVFFPMPRENVRVEILKRDEFSIFQVLFSKVLDTDNILQSDDKSVHRYQKKLYSSGPPSHKLDIVFISEGYTADQKKLFLKDAEKFKNYLFTSPAYTDHKNSFNITAVFIPSEEEGVDIPGDSVFVNTLLDAHFGTFGVDRYLTLPDQDKIFKCLVGIPCEQVCVLVNSEKYGGGGVFNHYNIFTAHNLLSGQVFLHEFGHGFASLADEYFNSEVPYEEQDSIFCEPYEPNVTALIDFDSKWKNLVSDTIPVPTPDTDEYEGVTGVFEGGRYLSNGYYRPSRNCMMRTLEAGRFCEACKLAIQRMIVFYSE